MRKPLLSVAAAVLLSAASFQAMAQEAEKPAAAESEAPAAPAEAPAAKPAGETAAGAEPKGEGADIPKAEEREAVGSDKAKEKQGPDEMGMYMTAEGIPTYNIQEDGTVDRFTYGGYRTYHAVCHVCHGPEASGSTFAPALKDSLKTLTYAEFLETVSSGRKREGATGNSVMPAFGTNPNVMCHINELYVYLKARADGVLPPGRPPKKDPTTDAFSEQLEACLGS